MMGCMRVLSPPLRLGLALCWLAVLLVAISEAAGAVSDHLGLRFFAHVDVSQRTQSS